MGLSVCRRKTASNENYSGKMAQQPPRAARGKNITSNVEETDCIPADVTILISGGNLYGIKRYHTELETQLILPNMEISIAQSSRRHVLDALCGRSVNCRRALDLSYPDDERSKRIAVFN